MKIKIVSNGTGATTKVVDAETGVVIEGITKAEWSVNARGLATATLTFIKVPVEVEGETDEGNSNP